MTLLCLFIVPLLANIFLNEKVISHITSLSNKFTDIDDKYELGFKSNEIDEDYDGIDYPGIFENTKTDNYAMTSKDIE